MPDHVAEVRRLVAERSPADERESRSREVFLRELDRLARPFDRHADPVHVTASAIVVGTRGTVLLLLHKRLGLWLQPGGHVEEGEAPHDAAWREAEEETGLPLSWPGGEAGQAGKAAFVHLDVHPGGLGHTHLDLRYLLEAPDADPAPPPDESQDVRWFGWDEAIAMADPGLVGALRELRPR